MDRVETTVELELTDEDAREHFSKEAIDVQTGFAARGAPVHALYRRVAEVYSEGSSRQGRASAS